MSNTAAPIEIFAMLELTQEKLRKTLNALPPEVRGGIDFASEPTSIIKLPKGVLPKLCQWIGVPRPSLYRYLSGKPPSKAVAAQIYNRTGIPPHIWNSPRNTLLLKVYGLWQDNDHQSIQTGSNTKTPIRNTSQTLTLEDIF